MKSWLLTLTWSRIRRVIDVHGNSEKAPSTGQYQSNTLQTLHLSKQEESYYTIEPYGGETASVKEGALVRSNQNVSVVLHKNSHLSEFTPIIPSQWWNKRKKRCQQQSNAIGEPSFSSYRRADQSRSQNGWIKK